MLAAILLASALAGPADAWSAVTVRISEAQSAYRDCIADTIAVTPVGESRDLALGAALGACREAELALRAESKAAPDASAAQTLALVLDTRIEGEEKGMKRRESETD